MKKSPLFLLALFILVLIVGFLISGTLGESSSSPYRFDRNRAYKDVEMQLSFGARTPGSLAHQSTIDYIVGETQKAGWQVELHQTRRMGHPITNVIAKRPNPNGKQIIIGAHFDSRFYSDQDSNPDNRLLPVAGANDGASGVAVLLELARSLPPDLPLEIWLVFFDAEDQGNIPGWDWILGSRAFVEEISIDPAAVVILDMIGDADLNIHFERNSNPQLSSRIWETARELGYERYFIPEYKYSILDDHIPFLEKGYAAVNIIDFDYPYWHTQQDTLDKVTAESLGIVGEVIFTWLSAYN